MKIPIIFLKKDNTPPKMIIFLFSCGDGNDSINTNLFYLKEKHHRIWLFFFYHPFRTAPKKMMRKTISSLALLIALFTTDPVHSNMVFPVSTEMQIGKIRNLVDRAPKGIFLTVGAERAFRGASLFEKIEHLIIIDISPEITRYNKINIELLRASTKEEYKTLRWTSSFLKWQEISQFLTKDDFDWWNNTVRNQKGYSIPEELNKFGFVLDHRKYLNIHKKLMSLYPKVSKFYNEREKIFLKHVSWSEIEKHQKRNKELLTKDEFDWWDKERGIKDSCVSVFIEDPSQSVDLGQIIDYKSGNYLFDDKLYERLHSLVLTNKIMIVQLDLTKESDLNEVIKKIQALNTNLALLDLDNLYFYDYMGEIKFRWALDKLIKLGTKDSILILMHNYKQAACAQFSIYIGFTFENIKNWPNGVFVDTLFERLSTDLVPLLDGRLYEKGDTLPLTP